MTGSIAAPRAHWNGPPLLQLLAVLAFAILFAAGALYYATIQNVWIDETTQLLGSRLPLGALFRWLGGMPLPLGVPADRAPPVTYLADELCGATVCGGVLAFRLFHLAIASVGLIAMLALVARRYGMIALAVAGALLALSPKLTEAAIEIRAYPLFFTITTIQILLFYRLFDKMEIGPRRLVPFVLVGVVAIYIHFFALVSTSGMFVGLFIGRARSRRAAAAVLAGWAVVLVAAIGLAPFVTGAVAASNAGESAARGPLAVTLFLLRVIVHPAMLVAPVAAPLYGVALLALLLITLWRVFAARRTIPLRAPLGPLTGLLVALVAGLTATILASFVARGFQPLKPSYSIWVLPMVAVLAGGACAPDRDSALRCHIARAAAASLLAAAAIAQAFFLIHAGWFVHGPERAIAAEMTGDPRETAIVYTDDGWAWGYFPLFYRHGDRLRQWRADAQGGLHPILTGGVVAQNIVPPSVLNGYRTVLLVAVANRTYADLRVLTQGGTPAELVFPPRGTSIGIDMKQWIQTDEVMQPGFYWLRMARLRRIAPR